MALDLGVSSPQLDEPARGFSFRADGPLDMRMAGHGSSAADLVNTLPETALAEIIRTYGEERFARRVARAIVRARETAPITRTGALADLVRKTVPGDGGIDPATRTFQALRIAVNDEQGELERGLAAAERMLAPGGRIAVASFHSLEDRNVKNFLRARSGAAPHASRHAPASRQAPPSFRLLTRKPVMPGRRRDRPQPARPFRPAARGRAHRGSGMGGHGMIRPSIWLSASAVVLVGYAMFQVKNEVMQQEATLAHITQQIAESRDAVRNLTAEWGVLTQPARLNGLAQRYLNLVPIGTKQLGAIAAIPLRTSEPAPTAQLATFTTSPAK